MLKNLVNQFLIIATILVLLFSCAKRGTPTGGPVDEEAPEILRLYPENYTTNFKATTIEITFDEYVKLKDVQQQLVISPPLKTLPIITPQGGASRTVTIEIQDTLKENTTYTFNFGQSIVDHNEGNPYPFFRYVFSTGEYIDSLQLKGKITDALDFKPADFVNVMLYKMDSTYTDSIIYKQSPTYVLNTLDSLSSFTMENLAAGTYRMIGLKEENRDLRFDPARDKIGFVSDPVVIPTNEEFEIKLYKPLLDNEVVKATHEGKTRFHISYTGELDSLKVKAVDDQLFTATRLTKLEDKDTLQFWFKPVLEADSVVLNTSFKDYSKEVTIKIKDLYKDSITISQTGSFKLGGTMDFTASTPLSSYDISKMKLINKDSADVTINARLDEFKNLVSLEIEEKESELYRLKMLPGALTDFYGETNDTIDYNYTTKATNSYGNFIVTLQGGTQWPAIVQIVKEDLTLVAEQVALDNGLYNFEYIDPGNYLVRVIYDENANGRYDTGNFLKNQQPEKVVYLPEIKKLLANWDLRETIVLE